MLVGSTFSILWLICGLIAVMTMLLLLGGKPESESRSRLRWSHRIFGWTFTSGYVIFLILMIPKYHGNSPALTSSIALHSYIAIAILPLLLLKHYIVRVAKKFFPALPYIGITIFTLAFIVVATTGISLIILWTKVPKMTVQSSDGPRIVSTAIGRDLYQIKCARCHELNLLYKGKRNEKEWRNTINRMQNYDKALILTEDQIDHIVGYLLLER